MKKTLTILCLFFVIGCATAETNKQAPASPMDRVGQALEKILLPRP
jgi:hypothetical protein